MSIPLTEVMKFTAALERASATGFSMMSEVNCEMLSSSDISLSLYLHEQALINVHREISRY